MIPDINPENVSWETFGFPDPGMVPASIGYIGLRWALFERELINGGYYGHAWDIARFLDEWPKIGFSKIDKHFHSDIDNRIEVLTRYNYLHPDRLDGYLRGTYSFDQAKWTMDELLTAAAGGNVGDVIRRRQILGPEYNLAWLKQRYNAINLLRYATVNLGDIRYHYQFHSGIKSELHFNTLDGLLSYAAANDEGIRITSEYRRIPPPIAVRYVYNDDGYYSLCSYRQITRIIPFIPTGCDNWTGYLGLNLYVPENNNTPPSDLIPGHNRLSCNAAGDFTLPDSDFPFWAGKTLTGGRSMEYALCSSDDYLPFYYDLYSQFHFVPPSS